MTSIQEIINELESFAPLTYQEEYDNSGLLIGNNVWQVNGVLLTLDCTEEVIDEAIRNNCNLIIAHHPIIFSGLKKINGYNYTERSIIKAIKNNIAIYACHTNLDNVKLGVNKKIADKLGLKNTQILAPKRQILKKLTTFVPPSHHQVVLQSLFAAGAGNVGNYSNCSFSSDGKGTFKGNKDTVPFIGTPEIMSLENEIKIELVFEIANETKIIASLIKSHPYEEVAYHIYPLSNQYQQIGSGMIGDFEKEMDETDFLTLIKTKISPFCIRHTQKLSKKIKKVAICGGSGQFLLKTAIQSGANAFITADFKYHQFFDADNKLILLDVGHFESEQFTPEIFYDIIKNKFSTFAIHLSKINTNPINYF